MNDEEAIRRGRELQDRVLSVPINERSLIIHSSEAMDLYASLDEAGQCRVYLAVHHANDDPLSGELIGEWNAWPDQPGLSPSFPLYRTRFAGVEVEYTGSVRPGGGIRVEKLKVDRVMK